MTPRTPAGTPPGVAHNSALALVADIAGKLGLLGAMVLSARLLSTSEYARLGVAAAAVGILTAVLDAGVSVMVVRDGARSPADRGGLLMAGVRGRLPLLGIALVGAVAVGAYSGRLTLALLAAALAVVNALTLSVLAVFRAAQNLRFEAVFKLALGISWPLATIAAARFAPTATAVVAGMSVVSLAALLGLLPLVPGNAILRARRSARGALRAAAPLGLMAAATLVYFRSGTIMLGAWGTSAETAAFTVASTIGFGLLALPNAITTALLPRLSFETNLRARVTAVRQALASGFVCCSLAAAATVVLGGPLIARAFGAEYRSAETPLVILALATVLIGLNGMLGVALIALRRLRILGAQVAVSLAANLVATALLVPRAGAVGAAWAVVVTEVVGLLVLAPACTHALPGLFQVRRPRLGARVARADDAVAP